MVGRPFKKGQSGNPGGLPKGLAEVKGLARTYTVEAISRLAEWMKSDNAKASVSACAVLLDRGWGKPQQDIGITPSDAFIQALKQINAIHQYEDEPVQQVTH